MTVDDREAMLRRGDALWERLRAALDARIDTPRTRRTTGPATTSTRTSRAGRHTRTASSGICSPENR